MSRLPPFKNLDRRSFLGMTAAASTAMLVPSWIKAFAAGTVQIATPSPEAGFAENLYWAFLPILSPEHGESDEFTTIANIERLLTEHGVPVGTTVIGIGARSGTVDDVYGAPGEMGYVWTFGEPWQGHVTNVKDASPVPLGKDDPIIVTQVGVLAEDTAHRFEIDDPSLAGSVLWTFYEDETVQTVLHRGLHNSFSDVDGGATETLFHYAQAARSYPDDWANAKARRRLAAYFPNLWDDAVWENFQATFGMDILHQQWLPYIRQQGWQGAAVVLRGSFMNVNQFHLREWNAKSPQDPEWELFKGTHTLLKVRYGREVRPYVDPESAEWTKVGFIWDMARADATPSMEYWQHVSDIFGHPFHIHGFRDDGAHGGHTLCCALGATGKLSVALYPLRFAAGESAVLFNNDLQVVAESLVGTADGLRVTCRNNGENFARNVRVDLQEMGGRDSESITLPLVGPRQDCVVEFKSALARSRTKDRAICVDVPGHFIEGGAGKKNNVLRFDGDLHPQDA